jgi:hypothetical protein
MVPVRASTSHATADSSAPRQPAQVRANEPAIPSGANAPLRSERSPLRLPSGSTPVRADAVLSGFRQPLVAAEAPPAGARGKSLVYSLSTSLP